MSPGVFVFGAISESAAYRRQVCEKRPETDKNPDRRDPFATPFLARALTGMTAKRRAGSAVPKEKEKDIMNTCRRVAMALTAAMLLSSAAYAASFDTSCYSQSNHEIFVSGFQRFVTAKNRKNGGINKTKARPTAGLLGYRYSTPQWSAGVAVSYEASNPKNYMDNGMFRMRDETIGVSLFGKYNGMSGWYAQAAFFTGFNDKKVRDGNYGADRISGNGSESSTYYAAMLETGRLFELGSGMRVTPHLGLNYSYTPEDDLRYRDSANASQRLSLKHQNYLEIPLGVTLAREFCAADWKVTPSVDLTLVSTVGNINDENYNYRSGFAAYDGSKWQVQGIGGGHWGGRFSAGINAVKSEKIDLGVSYTYEARKKYNDHRIMAGVGFKF